MSHVPKTFTGEGFFMDFDYILYSFLAAHMTVQKSQHRLINKAFKGQTVIVAALGFKQLNQVEHLILTVEKCD